VIWPIRAIRPERRCRLLSERPPQEWPDARHVPQPVGMCTASRTTSPPVYATLLTRRMLLRVFGTLCVISTAMIKLPALFTLARPEACAVPASTYWTMPDVDSSGPVTQFQPNNSAPVWDGRERGGPEREMHAPRSSRLSTTRSVRVRTVWEKPSAGVQSGWEMRTSLGVR
jgi:hypothetical protein